MTIIDFGLAVAPTPAGTPAAAGRGGIDFFIEPELAAARLAQTARPSALSAAGEQYSVAALVYLLLTGAHTHTFSLEPAEMLGQLRDDPPLPFERHGIDDLRAVARVVLRALAKQPGDRHGSLADMLGEFRAAAAADLAVESRPVGSEPGPARLLLADVLDRLALPDGELSDAGRLAAPTASVQNGAAGFAYALLRVAGLRDDERLLGQADLWSARALAAAPTSAAFWSEELEIVPETFGEASLHHSVSGVHAVAAQVAGARGDEWSRRSEVAAFIAAASRRCPQFDVAFGRAGLLLGCALLLEGLPADHDEARLHALGDRLRDSLAAQIAGQPSIMAATEMSSLGAAHGWAGVLYALLRWSEAAGPRPAPPVAARLDELAALGSPAGRGARWPHGAGAAAAANPMAAGWCNGAAGFVALWTLAHRLTGDEAFARLARAAAWTAYEDPTEIGDLCCGLAGRAYALLNLYRHDGDEAWLARARDLADRAALAVRRRALRTDSLYKGEIGVALLAADLEDPRQCGGMPMFEGEGWPRRAPISS